MGRLANRCRSSLQIELSVSSGLVFWNRLFRVAAFSTVLLSGCFFYRRGAPTVPEDEARHRAALSTLVVINHTAGPLTIAFRAATPPVQEVNLGTVQAGIRTAVAPIPAGEPIVLIARTSDGGEFALSAQSYPLDDVYTWEIPANTVFRKTVTRG